VRHAKLAQYRGQSRVVAFFAFVVILVSTRDDESLIRVDDVGGATAIPDVVVAVETFSRHHAQRRVRRTGCQDVGEAGIEGDGARQ